jgi:hypothetical protein
LKLRSLFLRIVGVKTPAILLFILKLKKKLLALFLTKKKPIKLSCYGQSHTMKKGELKSIG